MIEVKDRIPTYPGRVKLVPVQGQADTYDMVRADEPVEVGTPINKALFDSITGTISDAVQAIDNKIFEMTQRVEGRNLANGAPFGLYENGVLVPYYKVRNDYNGSGRVLALRADITHIAVLYDQNKYYYSQNSADTWLNGEFLNRFDDATRNVLTGVSIDVIDTQGLWSIYRTVFLLSLEEYSVYGVAQTLGQGNGMFTTNGNRVATYNGSPTAYHTRDTSPAYRTSGVIDAEGGGWLLSNLTTAGIRPAFTLPPTFEVVAGRPKAANTMATAEVV